MSKEVDEGLRQLIYQTLDQAVPVHLTLDYIKMNVITFLYVGETLMSAYFSVFKLYYCE